MVVVQGRKTRKPKFKKANANKITFIIPTEKKKVKEVSLNIDEVLEMFL